MTDDEKENWLNQTRCTGRKKTFNEKRENRDVEIKQIQELKEREKRIKSARGLSQFCHCHGQQIKYINNIQYTSSSRSTHH